MKKNSTKGYVILGILFTMVSIISLTVPISKTETFWIAYVFTSVAFATQIGIWKSALRKEETLKSKFLGFTVIHIGFVYVIIQIFALVVFLFVPKLPAWVAIMVCSLIAGISAVCMITSNIGNLEIEKAELKIQPKVIYLKELHDDIQLLAKSERNINTKISLIHLAEKVRFSDPMSSDILTDIENQISSRISELKIIDDVIEHKMAIINEIISLLDERNHKCKFLK